MPQNCILFLTVPGFTCGEKKGILLKWIPAIKDLKMKTSIICQLVGELEAWIIVKEYFIEIKTVQSNMQDGKIAWQRDILM